MDPMVATNKKGSLSIMVVVVTRQVNAMASDGNSVHELD